MSEKYYFQNDLTVATDPASESSADDNSVLNEEGGEHHGFFEGPEKTMEVLFRTDIGCDDGLRALSRAQLDHLCELAKCSILSKISSSHMDAYVLSESSLMIYKYKYIMKTCGTTTLLRCLNTLLKYADELQMEVESVVYSRKNLTCPTAQMWPHSSFGEEIKYINTHANLQERLHGNGYILGPVTGDHWFIYVADLTPVESVSLVKSGSTTSVKSNVTGENMSDTDKKLVRSQSIPASVNTNGVSIYAKQHSDRTLNIMMFGLAPEVCANFFQKNVPTGKEMTKKSGISLLCPGATIDETSFTPCGYSMNAILHDSYYTVHITPEESCSYASFETNACLTNYSPLVRNALTVFRPTRFVVTLFGDETGIHSMSELPTDLRRIDLPGVGSFTRTSQSNTKIATECCCFMAVYTLDSTIVNPSTSSKEVMAKEATFNSLLSKRPRGYSVV